MFRYISMYKSSWGCSAEGSIVCTHAIKDNFVAISQVLLTFGVVHKECLEIRTWKFDLQVDLKRWVERSMSPQPHIFFTDSVGITLENIANFMQTPQEPQKAIYNTYAESFLRPVEDTDG